MVSWSLILFAMMKGYGEGGDITLLTITSGHFAQVFRSSEACLAFHEISELGSMAISSYKTGVSVGTASDTSQQQWLLEQSGFSSHPEQHTDLSRTPLAPRISHELFLADDDKAQGLEKFNITTAISNETHDLDFWMLGNDTFSAGGCWNASDFEPDGILWDGNNIDDPFQQKSSRVSSEHDLKTDKVRDMTMQC